MNLFWLVIGLLLGGGLFALWSAKHRDMKPLDWMFVVFWALLAVFTVALITTFAGEIYPGAGRAQMIAGLIFGGLTVITGVLIFRKLFTARQAKA